MANVDKVMQIMREHNLHGEVYNEPGNVVAVHIERGDWKHDHAALKYFATEVLAVKKVETEVTEEDGSDTFSAIHRFTF